MDILAQTLDTSIVLVEIEVLNSLHTIETLYYSNVTYVTSPSDTISNIAYTPKLINSLNTSRNIFSGSRTNGLMSSELSSIELGNSDGVLDTFFDENLVIGRNVVIKQGTTGLAYASFTTVFTGSVKEINYSDKSVALLVENYTSKLDIPISTEKYVPLGGAGVETFNTSLHGTRVPLCYGVAKNVKPKYVKNILVGDTTTSTWDPYFVGDSTLSVDLLTATCTNTGIQSVFSRIGVRNGSNRYIEFHTNVSGNAYVGITNTTERSKVAHIGSSVSGIGYSASDGTLLIGNTSNPYSDGYIGGAVIGVAINGSSGSVWFSKNGVWEGDPSAGTGAAYEGFLGDIIPAISMSILGDTIEAKFDPLELTYAAPTGYNLIDDDKIGVTELTYQVHEAEINNVICVHSNGADLLPDQFYAINKEGLVQVLIGSAVSAVITADVQGATAVPVYDKASSILTYILSTKIDNIGVDSASFAALAIPYFSDVSIVDRASCGVYLAKEETVRKAIELFLESFGMYAGFNETGVFDIGVFKGPTTANSLGEITEEFIEEVYQAPVAIPFQELNMGYARNHHVLSEGTVAQVVLDTNPDQYAFMTQEWRTASAIVRELGIRKVDDVVEEIPRGSEADYWDIVHRYPTAVVSGIQPSVIFSGIDALLEAKRKWRLYNSGSNLSQPINIILNIPKIVTEIKVNDTFQVFFPRNNLELGTYVVVTSINLDLLNTSTKLTAWTSGEDTLLQGLDVDVQALEASFVQYLGCEPIHIGEVVSLAPYGDTLNNYGKTQHSYAT